MVLTYSYSDVYIGILQLFYFLKNFMLKFFIIQYSEEISGVILFNLRDIFSETYL